MLLKAALQPANALDDPNWRCCCILAKLCWVQFGRVEFVLPVGSACIISRSPSDAPGQEGWGNVELQLVLVMHKGKAKEIHTA